MKKINEAQRLGRYQSLNHIPKVRRDKMQKLKIIKRRIRKKFLKRHKNHNIIQGHENDLFKEIIKLEDTKVSNGKKIEIKNEPIINFNFGRSNIKNNDNNDFDKNFLTKEKNELNFEEQNDNKEDSLSLFINDGDLYCPMFYYLENEDSFESSLRPYIDNLLNQSLPRPKRLVPLIDNRFQINSNSSSFSIINNRNSNIINNNRNNEVILTNRISQHNSYNNLINNSNSNNNLAYYHISLSYNMGNSNNHNSNNNINNNNNNIILNNNNIYSIDNEIISDNNLEDFIDDFFYNYNYRRNKKEIKSIKKNLSKIKYKQNINLEERCPICIENFKNRQTIYNLPCSHIFHVRCLNKELKNRQKCPMCRIDLRENLDLFD